MNITQIGTNENNFIHISILRFNSTRASLVVRISAKTLVNSLLNMKTLIAAKIADAKKRFEKLDHHHRLYWYATPFAFAGYLTTLLSSPPLYPGILYIVAGLIFSLGFLKWILKYVNPFSPGIAARFLINMAHAFVLVISVVFSRNIVSNAIGSPANYFDLTVSMMALISYIPTYIALITVASTICFAIFFITAGICYLVVGIGFGNVDSQSWPLLLNAKVRINATMGKALGHAIGAVSLAIFGAFAVDSFLYISKHVDGPIRLFAYAADFQPPGNYPCISPNTRIRLEDNGIIAFANIDKLKVSISNKVYTPPTSNTLECSAK